MHKLELAFKYRNKAYYVGDIFMNKDNDIQIIIAGTDFLPKHGGSMINFYMGNSAYVGAYKHDFLSFTKHLLKNYKLISNLHL